MGRIARTTAIVAVAAACVVAAQPAVAADLASMTVSEANTEANAAVAHSIRSASKATAACATESTSAVARCTVRWRAGRRSWKGTVSLTRNTTEAARVYTYRLRGSSRLHRKTARVSHTGTVSMTLPQGQSRSNPIPLGTAATADGWSVQVVGTIPDATSAVLAENRFNAPPSAGGQFYIARVRVSNVSAASDTFDGGLNLRSVGASAVSYTTFERSCGVIPDPLSDTTVFTGGAIEGNVCWQVAASDVASLVMYDAPLGSDAMTFFALG
jgi:hypothetical protein